MQLVSLLQALRQRWGNLWCVQTSVVLRREPDFKFWPHCGKKGKQCQLTLPAGWFLFLFCCLCHFRSEPRLTTVVPVPHTAAVIIPPPTEAIILADMVPVTKAATTRTLEQRIITGITSRER